MSRRVCGFPWSFGATGGVARRNPPGLLDSAEEHHGTPYPLVMFVTLRHGFSMALIEIDGLPLKMGGFSMAI